MTAEQIERKRLWQQVKDLETAGIVFLNKRRVPKRVPNTKSYLYFIKVEGAEKPGLAKQPNFYKIGTTCDLLRRMKQHKSGSAGYKAKKITVLWVSQPLTNKNALSAEARFLRKVKAKRGWRRIPKDRMTLPQDLLQVNITTVRKLHTVRVA